MLARLDEGQGHALATGPTRAPDAMDVLVRIRGARRS